MQFQLSEILQIVTLVTLITGFLFGIIEIRHANRARIEKGALDVLRMAISTEHIHASYSILELPEPASVSEISNSPALRDAANTLMVHYEYLGNLVYQGIVPLPTLDLLVGGVVRACWRRLRPYIEEQRRQRNLENIAEWFQWLAERLDEHGRSEKALGAHVAFKDWSP